MLLFSRMGLFNNIHPVDLDGALVPGEDPREFQAFQAAFVHEFNPRTPAEARHVATMAHHAWLANRAQLLQTQILASLRGDDPGPAFPAHVRQQTVNERLYEDSLAHFLRARAGTANPPKEAGKRQRDPNDVCLMRIGENGNWEPMPGSEDKFDLAKWRRTHGNEPVNLPEGYLPPNLDELK